jgi:hypothetical protein
MPAVRPGAGRGETGSYQRVTDLLGGPRVFTRPVMTQLDAHNAIKTGLPGGALHHLVTQGAPVPAETSLPRGRTELSGTPPRSAYGRACRQTAAPSRQG